MTIKLYAIALFLSVLLLTGGCAREMGQAFDPSLAGQLQPGVTTEDEAIALFGRPTSVTTNVEGRQMLQWLYVRGALNGGSSAHLAVVFGTDHKMIRIAHQSTVN